MPVSISRFRLSLISTETVLDFLLGLVPSGTGLKLLQTKAQYEAAFDKVLAGKDSGTLLDCLDPPWQEPSARQWFWRQYLGGVVPGDIDGRQAWKNLVPFRARTPLTVQCDWLPEVHFYAEAFIYPHGIAFAATFDCDMSDTSLNETVSKAMQIRQRGAFKVGWSGDSELFFKKQWDAALSKECTFEQLKENALDAIRLVMLGKTKASGARTETFSVFSVLKGGGVAIDTAPAQGGETHKALDAVTSWDPDWEHSTLPGLDKSTLHIKRGAEHPGHLLYSSRRGRTVWFPAFFAKDASTAAKISRYHRNLVLASLQVDSLCGLMHGFAGMSGQGSINDYPFDEFAPQAARIVDRLYRGPGTTYRSNSIPRQILQSNFIDDVNDVRKSLNMAPLA